MIRFKAYVFGQRVTTVFCMKSDERIFSENIATESLTKNYIEIVNLQQSSTTLGLDPKKLATQSPFIIVQLF